MSELFTRMEWDLLEYNIEMDRYRREHGLVQDVPREQFTHAKPPR